MSFDALLNQTATLKRLDNTTDRYNNIKKVYDTEEENIKVRVDYQNASEEDINANSTITTARIYTRYADINAHDVLEVDSISWLVVGDPIKRQDGFSFHHYEINVKKVNA